MNPVRTSTLSYLASLHAYLLSFTQRTQPLIDVEASQAQAAEEFDKLWKQGQITGWDDGTGGTTDGDGIWCSACTTLSVVSSWRCAEYKVSGQKMYAKQTVYDAHINASAVVTTFQR